MREYNITAYPYCHGILKTDVYYEVYFIEDGKETPLALFGSLSGAEDYIVWKKEKTA
jgi:hypothetical protein